MNAGELLVRYLRTAFGRLDRRIGAGHLRRARHWLVRVSAALAFVWAISPDELRIRLALPTTLSILALVTTIGWLWWRLGPRRWWVFGGETRRAHFTGLYTKALADSRAPGLALVHVKGVVRTTPHGSRCQVELADGTARDAWFWHANPERNAVMLVRAQASNKAEDTTLHMLYIGSKTTGSGVVYSIPHTSWRMGRLAAERALRPLTLPTNERTAAQVEQQGEGPPVDDLPGVVLHGPHVGSYPSPLRDADSATAPPPL